MAAFLQSHSSAGHAGSAPLQNESHRGGVDYLYGMLCSASPAAAQQYTAAQLVGSDIFLFCRDSADIFNAVRIPGAGRFRNVDVAVNTVAGVRASEERGNECHGGTSEHGPANGVGYEV